MTGRSLALAACLLLLSASPRSGAPSPMGANGPTSAVGPADPLRLPDLSDRASGIRIPRSAWMALAVGGVLARETLRRENAAEAAYVLDRSFLDGPADVGNVWGNGLTVAAGSAGLFGLGVLTREPSLRDAGKDLGTAFRDERRRFAHEDVRRSHSTERRPLLVTLRAHRTRLRHGSRLVGSLRRSPAVARRSPRGSSRQPRYSPGAARERAARAAHLNPSIT